VGRLEADLFGFAERLTEDAQGRIPLPKLHLELTGLGSKVVIVGAKNRLEVRDRDEWLASQRERFASLPQLVAKVEARKKK
jgi:DNA-binding transcriptional regulator/RsmH inhibitor MraZ